MKVVILAAGKSSRFYPFSDLKHKSMLKLMGKTLLEHTLVAIKSSGLKEVVIVTGRDPYISDLIGDGSSFGLRISYVEQPEPLGMGDALLRVKEHIDDYFYLLNAYHFDFSSFKKLLESKKGHKGEMVLLAKEDAMAHKYGFLKVDGDRVLEVIEKPTEDQTPSPYRVIGIYLLHKHFFKTLEQVSLEEYNFESALTSYAQTDVVKMVVTDHETFSLKYPWDVLEISDYQLARIKSHKGKNVSIAKNVVIEGDVYIEDDVQIMEGACIKGPCYLGRGSVVGNNAIIRGGCIIGEKSVVGAGLELKHSVLLDRSTTHSGFIGDSVIGEDNKIAANITTGNVRLDRGAVPAIVKEKKVSSGKRKLGIITGSNVQMGISVSTMPGIIIGSNARIGPSTTVMENVEADTTFYTEFKTVRKKQTTTT